MYGSVAKTSLGKTERLQRRVMIAISKRNWLLSIDILLDNGFLTVFQLYLTELLNELLRQLHHEAPVQFLPGTFHRPQKSN